MPNVPKIVRERLGAAPRPASHPDANLLSAFAEHSLPERERTSVIEHLARCSDCRDVVALALPEAEALHAAPAPVRGGWFTWPAVRWGLVAAGVLMIATFGIRQYQHRPGETMVAKQETPQLQVPAAESHSSSSANGAPASATGSEGVLNSDKGATSNLADSEDKNALTLLPKNRADLKVAPVPSVGSPTSARSFSAPVGGVPRSGPAAPPQWPQQNTMNNFQNSVQWQKSNAAAPAAPSKQQPPGAGAGAAIGSGRESSVEVSNQAVTLETSTPNLRAKDSDQAAQTQAQFQNYGALVKAKPPVPSVPSAPASSPKNEYDALLAAGKMLAQAGQMSGYVVDPMGAAVSNARVTITPSSGGPASAITDGQGRWLIAGLPSGSYLARAEAPGFKTAVQGLKYDASHPSPYVFPLSIGNASETVEVAGESGLVQTEARADSAVSGSQAAQLPLSGRNLSQLANLVSWTISPAGSLQRSLDQGKTWQDVDVTAKVAGSYDLAVVTTNSQVAEKVEEKEVNKKALRRKMKPVLVFRAVAATGTDVWAAGNAGALYHSTDAGNSWIPVVPASASAALTGDIISLQFVDTQHGTIMTSTSEVWTTADSGRTWQKQ